MSFTKDYRNWIEFRQLPGIVEVDFHWSGCIPEGDYYDNMEAVKCTTLRVLAEAQNSGKEYVLFTHGHSTSRRGNTTSRSVVRSVMRSKEATPYIIRKDSIQHYSVFIAKIRPKPQ